MQFRCKFGPWCFFSFTTTCYCNPFVILVLWLIVLVLLFFLFLAGLGLLAFLMLAFARLVPLFKITNEED